MNWNPILLQCCRPRCYWWRAQPSERVEKRYETCGIGGHRCRSALDRWKPSRRLPQCLFENWSLGECWTVYSVCQCFATVGFRESVLRSCQRQVRRMWLRAGRLSLWWPISCFTVCRRYSFWRSNSIAQGILSHGKSQRSLSQVQSWKEIAVVII